MAVSFRVRLTPRGGRDAIEGVAADGVLRVRVSAPPVDGAANQALIRVVAKDLGVAASTVRVASGANSRVKRLSVNGADAAAVSGRWPGLRVMEDR